MTSMSKLFEAVAFLLFGLYVAQSRCLKRSRSNPLAPATHATCAREC